MSGSSRAEAEGTRLWKEECPDLGSMWEEEEEEEEDGEEKESRKER